MKVAIKDGGQHHTETNVKSIKNTENGYKIETYSGEEKTYTDNAEITHLELADSLD